MTNSELIDAIRTICELLTMFKEQSDTSEPKWALKQASEELLRELRRRAPERAA